jgi:hypothetical protein
MRATDQPSNAVDLYNTATGKWSVAQLSAARAYFAAVSVGSFAIFATGRVVNDGMRRIKRDI